MKNSTPSTLRNRRCARSEETETIERSGKTVVTIRKRRGEVEFELASEIREIPGMNARFKYSLMQAAAQFVEAEFDGESSDDL
jgi:hypothetical protein